MGSDIDVQATVAHAQDCGLHWESVSAKPMMPLGASVIGLDLCSPLHPTTAAVVRDLLRRHGLLLFQGQTATTPEMLLDFATSFCPRTSLHDPERCPHFDSSLGGLTDYPMIRCLGDDKDFVLNGLGYDWHADGSQLTLLFCMQAPDVGGETLFVSTRHLYDCLSEDKRRVADSLHARYSNRYTAGGPAITDFEHGLRMNSVGTQLVRPAMSRKADWQLNESTPLPVVFKRYGPPRLSISPKNLDHFEMLSSDGSWQTLSHEESQLLAEELLWPGLQPASAPAVDADLLPVERCLYGSTVLEHHWQPGDLLLWDNTEVQDARRSRSHRSALRIWFPVASSPHTVPKLCALLAWLDYDRKLTRAGRITRIPMRVSSKGSVP